MKRVLLSLLVTVAYAVPASAQVLGTQYVTALSGGACNSGACASFSLPAQTPTLTFDISGTFTATLTFEQSVDGVNWRTATVIKTADLSSATTTTGTGSWAFSNQGFQGVRVRATAFTSGTAVVTAAKGYAGNAQWLSSTPSFTTVYLGDGTAAAPSLTFTSQTGSGLYYATVPKFSVAGTATSAWTSDGGAPVFALPAAGLLEWSASSDPNGSPDLKLARDAANTLALRNGANAQAFRTYNTYTDASNYEFVSLLFSGNTAYIGTEKAGTGSTRALSVQIGGTGVWQFNTSGNLVDQGSHSITAGGLVSGNGFTSSGGDITTYVTAGLQWLTRSILKSPADGVISMTNSAATGFTRLILGTNDTNGAALKKNGANFDVVDGSDVNFTSMRMAAITIATTNANGVGFGTDNSADIGASSANRPRNLYLGSKIAQYNNVTTAGWGVPAIQASAGSTAQTAAVASVATYTMGAADGEVEVSANVLVTTSTAHSFSTTVSYTDEGNTARTLTLSFSQLTGAFVTAITNVTGAGPYEGVAVHLRCKASTAITIATTGTFTTVTYNVRGSIRQIA